VAGVQGDDPAVRSVVQAEEWPGAGEVEGAGSGQDVGQDSFCAAAEGFSATPGAAGEVADLAFHDGPVGPVALLPGRSLLAGLAMDLYRQTHDDIPAQWRYLRCIKTV
jgi:hypothetical protein